MIKGITTKQDETVKIKLPDTGSFASSSKTLKSFLEKDSAKKLTSKQILEQASLIFQLDVDHKGYVIAEDLHKANFSPQLVKEAMRLLDPRDIGRINLIQTFQIINGLNKYAIHFELVKLSFRSFSSILTK